APTPGPQGAVPGPREAGGGPHPSAVQHRRLPAEDGRAVRVGSAEGLTTETPRHREKTRIQFSKPRPLRSCVFRTAFLSSLCASVSLWLIPSYQLDLFFVVHLDLRAAAELGHRAGHP